MQYFLRCRGANLMGELCRADNENFQHFPRMSSRDFDFLLEKIKPYISKQDTRFRKAIPAAARLAVTLKFLTSGENYTNLHQTFEFSPQTISKIVPEVCKAIIDVLRKYVKVSNYII